MSASPQSRAPGRYLPLVTNLDAWDRAIQALASAEIPALFDLVSDGEVLPLPPDTALAIEDDFGTLAKVRVLGGEWADRIGWLPSVDGGVKSGHSTGSNPGSVAE